MKSNSKPLKPRAKKAAATRGPTVEGSGRPGRKPPSISAFERVLVDISTRFISLPADRVDSEIMLAQREVCESLGIDISALWQMGLDHPGSLVSTHIFAPPDFTLAPTEAMAAQDTFPWSMKKLFQGETIIISRMAELPAAAVRDLELYRYFGIKSTLAFPLSAGGGPVFGAVSFNEFRKERAWSTDIIDKLGLVAQIFANALARKWSDQALQESEARYRDIFERAIEGVYRVSLEGKVLFANPALAKILGYDSAGDFLRSVTDVGRQVWAVPEDRTHGIQRITREGALQGYECLFRRKDGTPVWVSLNTIPVYGPDGRIAYFDGFVMDIDARKQSEREVDQLRLERTHLARVLTANELSSALAHEINQPLGAILNNAEAARILLSGTPPRGEDIPEILDDIIQDAKRAGEVVRKVRSIVKKTDAQFGLLSVNSLIDEALAFLQSNLALSGVRLNLELAPDLADIRGDRIRLQQVLLNLVTNALDAMKDAPSKILTVRSAMDGPGLVTVSVGDSGPGIAEARRTLVFQPFFTTKKDGLGLGLSICRSIIEEHGGQIWAENNPAGGTIFSFSLKAWQEKSV